jgi:hypothetical protein
LSAVDAHVAHALFEGLITGNSATTTSLDNKPNESIKLTLPDYSAITVITLTYNLTRALQHKSQARANISTHTQVYWHPKRVFS